MDIFSVIQLHSLQLNIFQLNELAVFILPLLVCDLVYLHQRAKIT
ncbi:hypothetical protein VCJ_001140 [Vibrio metoecus]|nr:hypothetical protein VCJ_001140 [Vibrio metoecus]